MTLHLEHLRLVLTVAISDNQQHFNSGVISYPCHDVCTLKTIHCVYSCVLVENPCRHSLQTLIAETRLLDIEFIFFIIQFRPYHRSPFRMKTNAAVFISLSLPGVI